jgi:aminopeptidase N
MQKYLIVIISFFAHHLAAQHQLRQPDIDITHYKHHIQLSDGNDVISGKTIIFFQNKNPKTSEIVLDLIKNTGTKGMTVKAVLQDNTLLSFQHENDLLSISLKPNHTNQSIEVRYEGIPADGLIISKNKFGDRTFFGDNWANRARHWLPVIDHPADKATCEFVVTAPAHYKVIANGNLVEESDLLNGNKLTHWSEKTPIPTKVMVIGVAKFAVKYEGNIGGVPVSSWSYPQDRDKLFYDYAVATDVISFFQQYIGEYSYEKLANVESTTIYGGMENASCIFYTEKEAYGKPNKGMVGLVAHEIAHQWFGNSASEKDWRHVWLSEGFATYFSAMYIEKALGKTAFNETMNENKGTVFRYSQMNKKGVILPDEMPKDLITLLNPLSYQKAGWVLHILRHEIGEEAFQKGVQTYYQRFRNGNALTPDLIGIMEQTSGRSLQTFFEQWLKRPAYPDVTITWRYNPTNKTIDIKATQNNEKAYEIALEFQALDAKGSPLAAKTTMKMNGFSGNLSILCPTAPEKLIPDPDNWLLAKISCVRE